MPNSGYLEAKVTIKTNIPVTVIRGEELRRRYQEGTSEEAKAKELEETRLEEHCQAKSDDIRFAIGHFKEDPNPGPYMELESVVFDGAAIFTVYAPENTKDKVREALQDAVRKVRSPDPAKQEDEDIVHDRAMISSWDQRCPPPENVRTPFYRALVSNWLANRHRIAQETGVSLTATYEIWNHGKTLEDDFVEAIRRSNGGSEKIYLAEPEPETVDGIRAITLFVPEDREEEVQQAVNKLMKKLDSK